MVNRRWSLVTTHKFIAFSMAMTLFIVLLLTDNDGFVPILDHINLTFHEAGHGIFGLMGSTLGLYGGTLGQLLVPFLIAISFWKKGALFSYALVSVWFFENFLNIARYTADARAQILPLVGGGDHDWTNILTRWGILQYDTALAGFFTVIAWIGILAVWVWISIKWFISYKN